MESKTREMILEQQLETIYAATRGITFSLEIASKIVGGKSKLLRLIEEGKISVEKPNRKWYFKASEVLRYSKAPSTKSNK